MKKQNKKRTCKEMYKAVPDDVKIAFGKFYVFSFIYLLFFLIIYPFFLINYLNDFFSGIIFGFLVVFFIYMIKDTKVKAKTFASSFYYLLILCVFLAISFSIVKYFI